MPCSWKQGEYLCNSLKLSQTFLSPSWSPLHPCTFGVWLAFLQTCFRWKFYSEVSGFKKKRNHLIGKQAQGPKVSCLTGNNEQRTWNVRSVYIPERFVTQLTRTIQGQLCINTGCHWWMCPLWGRPSYTEGKMPNRLFSFSLFKNHITWFLHSDSKHLAVTRNKTEFSSGQERQPTWLAVVPGRIQGTVTLSCW